VKSQEKYISSRPKKEELQQVLYERDSYKAQMEAAQQAN
jgi:hypothetical protein